MDSRALAHSWECPRAHLGRDGIIAVHVVAEKLDLKHRRLQLVEERLELLEGARAFAVLAKQQRHQARAPRDLRPREKKEREREQGRTAHGDRHAQA